MRLVSAIYEEEYPFNNLPFVNQETVTSNPDDLKEGDLLVVWGGSDIHPSLYKKEVSKYTGVWSGGPSQRDQIEWALMNRAKELDIPIIGVCRGAQMLCALAGGFLIQHVENHSGTHIVTTIDGEEINTNSIHHQMMHPWGVPHEMLMSIKKPLSKVHLDVDTNIEVPEEPEYVYFPEVKGFAPQFHPEMMALNSPATKYLFKTITERINA